MCGFGDVQHQARPDGCGNSTSVEGLLGGWIGGIGHSSFSPRVPGRLDEHSIGRTKKPETDRFFRARFHAMRTISLSGKSGPSAKVA
jgi:hypothetical protein